MPSTKRPARTALVVGLLVLVALSGCVGLSDTDSPTPTPAEPTTPSPSVTQTPTPTAASPTATATPTPTTTASDRFSPGLTDTGVRNVTQLLRTHQARAIDTPGVLTHTTNMTLRNISLVTPVRVTADANLTRVLYASQSRRTTENTTHNSTTVLAANGTAVRQYTVTDGNVTLDNRRNRTQLFDRSLRGLSTATSPLRGALRRGNFSIATVDDGEDPNTVILRADRYAGGQLFDARNVVAYNATVRIGADGLIRSATERIVAQRNGTANRYEFSYAFEPRAVDLPAVPEVPADIRSDSEQSGSE
ncbi:hypothetical protein Hrd1104_11660 [Halorhabdus sp. CBA1104]|uniref:hypothetical protein n=1 Tax=unclassified Halorhabdus TaxID=2621901 RepID=UPI0012B31B9B|nr:MULTISPECIES: hypothetical protein [unclassified Halorhabdus]QGN07889.1 hypothetical protein Hrd1104_11660 [Halorhabdus sp. CBA1104]